MGKRSTSKKGTRRGTVKVDGHMRDGSYIPPHVRTPPDNSTKNNLSSK